VGKYPERTDPYEVKCRRHRWEVHDHRDGVCDLLSDPNRTAWTTGKCRLATDRNDPEMRCSCDFCSWDAPWVTRKRRREGRREAAGWFGDPEFDGPDPPDGFLSWSYDDPRS
jgi:hypothetical protein